ncbi:hypothetical protein Mal4_57820 [Maioricimonas rarisocia]|uniref:Putative restriction endonuclease domain-containing protein n=1 Tax=Maioricimonas rarisocia TaxID=2528026 RepID=A0A517ZG13_9PLAN|nr:Uma2 family endonuclease [Maioricimonas rarisocia]QDU41415.1 hypothetical protein Mal4_57820 [Maioricimonas rarisocia]
MTTTTLITAEEFGQMTFDTPVELVQGEVVELSFANARHGMVCTNVAYLLGTLERESNGTKVVACGSGVITRRDPDSVRGADLLVVTRERLPGAEVPVGYFDVAPELIVEVVSPSDRWSDVIAKIAEYLQAGVQEAWIVDPEQKRIHVYHGDAEPRMFEASAEVSSRALPGLQFNVDDLFRGV